MTQTTYLIQFLNCIVPNSIKLTTSGRMTRVFLKFRRYSYLFKCRFRWLLVSCLIVFILYLLFTALSTNNHNYEEESLLQNLSWKDVIYSENLLETKRPFSKKEITILRYTKYYGHLDDSGSGVLNANRDCPHLKTVAQSELFSGTCRVTFDKSYLNVSDALVFHSHDLATEVLPEGPRDTTVPWVYFNLEPPTKTWLNLHQYQNIFNWTMTYRWDSDVYFPYNQISLREDEDSLKNITSHLTNLLNFTQKTEQVAWVVSMCHPPSKREYFVEELKKYINIDIFGYCGRKCPSPTWNACLDYVAQTHKFYLAFENSLCADYITEKLFNSLNSDMVPVVYGGRNAQDYISLVPNNSYIDASQFSTPRDLANYLIYLDRNNDEYLKYFEWKKKYRLITEKDKAKKVGWCNLCQRVYEHLKKDRGEVKSYRDLWAWWNFVGQDTPACSQPRKKFTDFNHGFFKVGTSGLLVNWARKIIFNW